MTFRLFTFKCFVFFLGSAMVSGSLVAPTPAQNRSATPYCFAVKDSLSVFSRPANNAATGDRFNRGDIAYATTSPPTTRFDGNRAFVEVAIYGGKQAWPPDSPPLMGCR